MNLLVESTLFFLSTCKYRMVKQNHPDQWILLKQEISNGLRSICNERVHHM